MRALLIALVSISLVGPAAAEPDKKTETPKAKAEKPAKPKAAPVLKVSPQTAAKSLEIDFSLTTPKKPEKRTGISLGDDSSWKTHAAQAGAMVLLFGALSGLCAGGGCTIPKAVTDPLPSWMKAKPHHVNNPRPPQKIRRAR